MIDMLALALFGGLLVYAACTDIASLTIPNWVSIALAGAFPALGLATGIDAIDVGGGFPARYSDSHPAPLSAFMDAITAGYEKLPVANACRLICEPGRALVAEAESLLVRVDARRDHELFINDGSYGALFDAAHLNFVFPVRMISRDVPHTEALRPFEFWGPTCDSIDRMKGPFMLPASIREGDWIEIGNVGAYGRAIGGRFNGYGSYLEAILTDEPMFTMYPAEQAVAANG